MKHDLIKIELSQDNQLVSMLNREGKIICKEVKTMKDIFEERTKENGIEFLRRNLKILREIAGLAENETVKLLDLESNESIHALEKNEFAMTATQYYAWFTVLDIHFLKLKGFLTNEDFGKCNVLKVALKMIMEKYYDDKIPKEVFKEFETCLSVAANLKREGREIELEVFSVNLEDIIFKRHAEDYNSYY